MEESSAQAQSRIKKMPRAVFCMRPFKFTGDAEMAWLGNAAAEDLLNEAVRLAGARGISHHSSFRPAFGDSPGALNLLGVSHLITGTLDLAASDLSLTLSLQPLDVTSKTEGFRVSGKSLQTIIDTAAQWIAAQVNSVEMPRPNWIKPKPRTPEDPMIFQQLCQARHMIWSFDESGNEAALGLINQILAEAPDHAQANGYKAFLLTRAYRSGWIMGRDTVATDVEDACNKAWAGNPDDAAILWTTAFAQGMIFRNYPLAADLIGRAVLFQPHASHIWAWGSMFMTYDLNFNAGLYFARQAMAISPQDPMGVTHGFAGALAAIHGARDAEALELCDIVLGIDPKMKNVLRIKAAAHYHLGQLDQAKASIATVLESDSNESVALASSVNPLREWPGFTRFLDGLSGAGLR